MGRCLRYNTSLITVACDGNRITLAGWQAIQSCLKVLPPITTIPLPSNLSVIIYIVEKRSQLPLCYIVLYIYIDIDIDIIISIYIDEQISSNICISHQ